MPKNSLFVIVALYILFSFASCNNNQQNNNQQTIDSIPLDTIAIAEPDTDVVSDYIKLPNPNILTADSTDFYYMISGLFEDQDTIRKVFPLMQKRKWNALTYEIDERKFYLSPIELDTVYWYDECNGVDMLQIESLSKDKKQDEDTKPNQVEYIYITGLDRPLGEIPSHFHTQTTINPEKPYVFEFNGIKYTLRAEGKYSSDQAFVCNAFTKNDMGRLENYVYGYTTYKLYLEAEGKSQLLNSDSYSSTCLDIYFIGDLDGDGKPDFLFETNSWYEGSEVTLFLSSEAQNGELVKNMGPSGNYYAC